MSLEEELSSQPLAADLALEGRLTQIVNQPVVVPELLALECLLAHLALERLVVGMCPEVVLHVALVGELLEADVAGEGLLLVLLHVAHQVLPTLEALVAHLAGVVYVAVISLRAGGHCVVPCRGSEGEREAVLLQVLTQVVHMVHHQLTVAAFEQEHVLCWVSKASSVDQVLAAYHALAIQVSIDSFFVHRVTNIF